MAKNGLRQLGPPRIGVFAERIRPEPLHLEINNWTHVLNVIYKEAVRRGRFNEFLETLKAPVKQATENSRLGCGLKFIAKSILEQYEKPNERFKKLDVRLIGAQAISLARYSFRLIDELKSPNENPNEMLKRIALSKICEILRDIGSEMNRVKVESSSYSSQIQSLCKKYFNLFALFFTEVCQSTVWTVGYALPYHLDLLYKNYGVGYGIISMQGKESKHSAIKQELKLGTNRSTECNETGKWNQIMRSSFVRNFYLPYHFPLKACYSSHYSTRRPKHLIENFCHCSRELQSDRLCGVCIEALIMEESVTNGTLTDELLAILKPIECLSCKERFPDQTTMSHHIKNVHSSSKLTGTKIPSENLIPATMSVSQLKEALVKYKKSTSGNKKELQRRLEGVLTFQ